MQKYVAGYGELCDGQWTGTYSTPHFADSITGLEFSEISAAQSSACAIDQYKRAWCWGFNFSGCSLNIVIFIFI